MQKFWKAIGLPRSKDMPAMLGWVEILTGCYLSTTFYGVVLPVITQTGGMKPGVIAGFIGFSLTLLCLMGLAVLLATRRGNRISYWIAIALLLHPTAMTVQRIYNAPDTALLYLSLPNILILGSSITAAILLLLPASKAWLTRRRAELKGQPQAPAA
jgi:hypothetical protein